MSVQGLRHARVLCLRWGLTLALSPGLFGLAALPAVAQVTQKIVTGKVVDKDGAAIHNAIVYLKNDRTMGVKSYISDSKGDYRFGQLSQGVDYELWAEVDGKKSSVKTVSSFDSKNTITITLKIDR